MAEPLTEIVVDTDLAALSRTAAAAAAALVRAVVAAQGRCTIALAGGSTPRGMYELLASDHRRDAPWPMVEWFWGDERCVPPDHSQSNYRMARDTLLSGLRVASGMVHPVRCAREPAAAAAAYDALLRDRLTGGRFDLMLLGVGADGHTASLFPGAPALDEQTHWALAVTGGAELAVRERVTVTYPVIGRARTVFMLAAGADKRVAVAAALRGDPGVPAGRVHPTGRLVWFLDRAARPGRGGAAA